jgi:hypothetical protein
MRKFGLELHPDKTRLIEFGCHAERYRKQRGEKKPETFDFLGFTHICGKTRNGAFHGSAENVEQASEHAPRPQANAGFLSIFVATANLAGPMR